MQQMQFTIDIKASKEKVWKTLWGDNTFRDWASVVDEGSYMVGEMKEGSKVEFISSVSGYGVTSFIEKLVPNEFVLFRHMTDTKDSGKQIRENEWTGSMESYALTDNDGITTLIAELDVPSELEGNFQDRYPKALERVKILAEGSTQM